MRDDRQSRAFLRPGELPDELLGAQRDALLAGRLGVQRAALLAERLGVQRAELPGAQQDALPVGRRAWLLVGLQVLPQAWSSEPDLAWPG